eukprot:gene486-912_t
MLDAMSKMKFSKNRSTQDSNLEPPDPSKVLSVQNRIYCQIKPHMQETKLLGKWKKRSTQDSNSAVTRWKALRNGHQIIKRLCDRLLTRTWNLLIRSQVRYPITPVNLVWSSRLLFKSAEGRRKSLFNQRFIMSLRGGSTETTSAPQDVIEPPSHSGDSCTVIVSTTIGSSFLDKKKKLVIPKNSTIEDLKVQINKKFPGTPPISMQRLIFGLRKVEDNELVGNLTTISPIPLLLDVISGTSAYNKTMTISQALEAYSSLTIHQAYLGDQLARLFNKNYNQNSNQDNINSSSSVIIETVAYRDMLESINTTLYSTYIEDIQDALEEEKEPEVATTDTAAWRSPLNKPKRPLAAAFAKEFDLNMKGFFGFVYYSILLAIFAYFGTTTQLSSQFLIFMVPVLWVSKVRQLRLLAKLVIYLILPFIPKIEFLMPLLPAPYQVIANQSEFWSDTEDENTNENEKNLVSDYDESNDDDENNNNSSKSNAKINKKSEVTNKKVKSDVEVQDSSELEVDIEEDEMEVDIEEDEMEVDFEVDEMEVEVEELDSCIKRF